jgi:hypothetical protein
MNCSKCDNQLLDGANFCNKCGEKAAAESTPVSVEKKGKKSTLTSVVSTTIFILAIGVGRYLTQGATAPSVTELASKGAAEAKASLTLPKRLNDVTTLVDITSEQNTIHYHYVLNDVDVSKISDSLLKNNLTPSVCQNVDTKNLLDKGIDMGYSYNIENASESFFVSITKSDCSQ